MRIVFRRPAWLTWMTWLVLVLIVVAIVAVAVAGDRPVAVVALTFVILMIAPLLLGWVRSGQRIELDADGLTVAGRVRSKHYTWAEVAAGKVRYPVHYWNDKLPTPPELADVEPAFVLTRPPGRNGTSLQKAAFESFTAFGKTEYSFHLREALTHLRSTEPDGDWLRQAAAVFAARDRDGRGPEVASSVPRAQAR